MDFPTLWDDAVVKDLDGTPIRVATIRHLSARQALGDCGPLSSHWLAAHRTHDGWACGPEEAEL